MRSIIIKRPDSYSLEAMNYAEVTINAALYGEHLSDGIYHNHDRKPMISVKNGKNAIEITLIDESVAE